MTIVTSHVLELANKAQFLYNLSGLFKMSSKCLVYEYMYGNISGGMRDIMYMQYYKGDRSCLKTAEVYINGWTGLMLLSGSS